MATLRLSYVRRSDSDTVVQIVALDWIGYTMADKPVVILARLLDRIEEFIDPPS